MPKLIDLSGQRFGRLTVIKRADNKRGRVAWLCKCDCGNSSVVTAHELRGQHTNSCGCMRVESGKTNNLSHGISHSRLHRTWDGMKGRCLNPNNHKYKDYGGRGIKICEEWKNSFEAFRDWAITNGYSDDLTIDRISVDGNYCPENCRWATKETQQNNKRTNRLLTYNGETRTMTEWGKIFDLDAKRIWARLERGWSIERALTTPTK